MGDRATRGETIRLVNPLPTLLGRYQLTLEQMLEAGGNCSVSDPVPSIEMHDSRLADRGRRGVEVARAIRHQLGAGEGLIVCVWPAFGLVDPVVWSHRGAPRVHIVVHDPVPMRRQFGSGRLAARAGRLAMRSNIETIVHSSVAADAVLSCGWSAPTLARHPMSAPRPRHHEGDGTVAVVGQYKPVRDIDLLARLGPALRARGLRPVILGRSWPEVPGWEVRDAFVPEAELTDAIAQANALIVPYTRYYQSGIAIRAAEVSVPVVGRRHPFLDDLFGDDWPGLVAGDHVDEWVDAVEASAGAGVLAPVTAYHQRAVADWQQVAGPVTGSELGPRVLLVGHDFVPERSSGDKNYWLALTAHLGRQVDWLGVASIVHGGPPHQQFVAGSTPVDLFALEPVYALSRLCSDREPHPPKCAGAFKRQPGSLTDHPLTLLRHGRRLRRIVEDHQVDVIHFMDNVGLGAALTRGLSRHVVVTMTYLGFYTVNPWRARYLSVCARMASGLVVGNTQIGAALRPYAVADQRTRVIPWGSEAAVAPDQTGRERARHSLVEHHRLVGDRLILWTGHTQQFGEAELHDALAAATIVTEADPGVEAVFLLKPECAPEKYQHLSTDRIRVCSSAGAPPFPDHLAGADLLLAPVSRADTVVTPPLTWIESMQAGTPVVSTRVPGVAEALGPLQQDLIAPLSHDPGPLAEILTTTLAGQTGPSPAAMQQWAADTYNLESSAAAYAEFWATMGRGQRRRSGA